MSREPSPIETGERSSAKKARVESPNGPLKQEAEDGALVAVDGAAAKAEITVAIDKAFLHCPLCTLPLTPPIFQCGVGHLCCGRCHGQLAGNQCHSCGEDGGVYARCFVMDAFVSSAVVPCPHEAYGCRTEVAYYQLGDHESACPHAPCACSEPGCGFLGSPPMLLAHLAAAPHSWPVDKLRYGEVLRLRVPECEPRRLLVAEEDDGRVFLLAVGEAGSLPRAVPVTVACVRARAAAGPRYTCKVWANGSVAPATGKVERVLMEAEVPSCSGGVDDVVAAGEEAMFLGVPRKMLRGDPKQIHLRVRVDKVSG
ncbi:hypothetical protein EJB05_31840 [Eragrostis curvula]|uniref:RING-type E3 ubiquitin transferase n=1 Tax=Eragrostis curvula TaxID=38414 RepID=A0A5J9UG90_9POAL|nr:hypothetical protein EJB05_31840 [Eragrostis curvula]